MRRREFIASLIGTAVAWPLAAQQPAKVYRIAIVSPSRSVTEMTETSGPLVFKVLFGGLQRLGYIEGQNLIVERYSGERRTAHYAELASKVVRQQPDVILTSSVRMVKNFKAATTTIPIVGYMGNPVEYGLVDSLARPGGNITGVTSNVGGRLWGKRLGLLHVLIPTASRVGLLALRSGPPPLSGWGFLEEAARQAGLTLINLLLEGTIDEAEYRRVFKLMTQERAEALIVSDQPEVDTYSRLIIELVEKSRLPAIFPYRFWAERGGLIAYGIDHVDRFRRLADYIARILQGANPSELPIDQATKIELVINLKTARTLGITVPQILLAGADEVIE
jgi:putative ABC transport system substrate-binding protein